MVYAKTKVAPPVSVKQVDQYSQDIHSMSADLAKAESASKEDSIYSDAINRIQIFASEGKLSNVETDLLTCEVVNRYASRFLYRCFDSFKQSHWKDAEHNHMLSQIRKLQNVKQSDNSSALSTQCADSLSVVSQVINKYRDARRISRNTSFRGISNAQSTIKKARSYANDPYLSNCKPLLNNLNKVPANIGQSHYNYISAQVEELANYHHYSQSEYDKLIPQVDAAVKEYNNKAAELYGSKKNVDELWARTRNYYDRAMNYYKYR